MTSLSGRLARVVKLRLLSSGTVGIYLQSLASAPLVKFYATEINQTFIPVQRPSKVKKSLTQLLLFLLLPAGSSASEPLKHSGSWRPRFKNRSFFSHQSWNVPSDLRQTAVIQHGRVTFLSQVLPTSADLLRVRCLFVITVIYPRGCDPATQTLLTVAWMIWSPSRHLSICAAAFPGEAVRPCRGKTGGLRSGASQMWLKQAAHASARIPPHQRPH